jgi:hypothetical protein
MENDITANPDYQLIMSFLKSIRPGDMSDEAATQLKMIGKRIQSGGSLSDQEREMFQSVMGAMPQMPMDQGRMATGAAMTDAEMRMMQNQGRMATGAAMTDAEMRMMQNQRPMATGAAMTDAEMRMMQNQQFNQDAQNFQGRAFRNNEGVYSGSSGVSSSLAPDTSMRPRPRPENLGQMRPRRRPASME